MGRPINADGRQTRLAILDAALELFADKGYFGTSLRDIAMAVGVRESGFYNYFESKEALFNALLATDRESKAEQWASFFAEPMTDVRSRLERLTIRVLDFFSEPRQQRLYRVLMSDGLRLAKDGRTDLVDKLTSGITPLHDLMRQLIADGTLQAANPEILAAEFMGPLLLWRQRHAIAPDCRLIVNRAEFIRGHVNHFLQGARAAGRPRHELRKSAVRIQSLKRHRSVKEDVR